MDELELPFVPVDTALGDVLTRLRSSKRGAVVTERPEGHVLVTAGDLLETWNAVAQAGKDAASATLAQVAMQQPGRVAMPRSLARGAFTHGVVGREGPRSVAQRSFARTPDPRYAVIAVDPMRALVVTASEAYGDALRTRIAICTCQGTPSHSFFRRQLRTPGVCNYPHAAKVICEE